MKRAVLWALLAAALGAAPAGAIMIEMPLDRIAADADAILRGRVVAASSRWNDENTTIVTDVTVAVTAAWKGAAPAGGRVTLTVPGGEVGEIGVAVEHAPAFDSGEDVVLFLEQDRGAGTRVLYDEQGKYTVAPGEEWIVGYTHLPVRFDDFKARLARVPEVTPR